MAGKDMKSKFMQLILLKNVVKMANREMEQ